MPAEHCPRMLQGKEIYFHKEEKSFCVYSYKSVTLIYLHVASMNLQTMGMAVMLDEIINYVQSLQQQVEVSAKKVAFINIQTNGLLAQSVKYGFACSSSL